MDDEARRLEATLRRIDRILLLDVLRRIPPAVREFTEAWSRWCEQPAGWDSRQARHKMIDIERGIPGMEGLAPKALTLAEALAAIDTDDLEFLAEIDIEAARALQGLKQSFPSLMDAWGWGPLAGPDGRRFWEEALGAFRRDYERPFFEAVISWRSDLSLPPDKEADSWARQGQTLGYRATMEPDAAGPLVEGLKRSYLEALDEGALRGRPENYDNGKADELNQAARKVERLIEKIPEIPGPTATAAAGAIESEGPLAPENRDPGVDPQREPPCDQQDGEWIPMRKAWETAVIRGVKISESYFYKKWKAEGLETRDASGSEKGRTRKEVRKSVLAVSVDPGLESERGVRG